MKFRSVLVRSVAILSLLALLLGTLAACSGNGKRKESEKENGNGDKEEDKTFEKIFGSLSDVVYDPLDHIDPPALSEIVINKSDVNVSVSYELAKVVMSGAENTSYTEKGSATLSLYDTARISYKGLPADEDIELSEETIAGMSSEYQKDGIDLVIGSGSFIGAYKGKHEDRYNEGFEDQLIGMSVGDERVIRVTFPDLYTTEELCGIEVDFTVKLISISRPKTDSFVPTDEQCDKYTDGKYKTLDEFRTYLENICVGSFAYSVFVVDTKEKEPCKELVDIYLDRLIHSQVLSQNGSSLSEEDYNKAYSEIKSSMHDLLYPQAVSSAYSYIKDNYIFGLCEVSVTEKEVSDAIAADWETNSWYYKYYYGINDIEEFTERIDIESLERQLKLTKLYEKLADKVALK